LFEFAIFTGLGRAEMVALTMDEVDLAAAEARSTSGGRRITPAAAGWRSTTAPSGP
jgi:hypothetical protein